MDKKDVSIIIGIGALFASAYSGYILNKQRESQDRLNKKIKRLATCHNNFVEFQEVYNGITSDNVENINDRMDYLEDESVSNYNHVVELEKSINDGYVKDDFSAENYVKEYCNDTEERVI